MFAPDLHLALSVATEAATRAATVVMQIRESGKLDIQSKGSVGDLVTRADKQAEALIVAALSSAFPDCGIIGEEGAGTNPQSLYQWIIDPIDGTSNFAHGRNEFGVSIGLAQEGRGVVGVIVYPEFGVTLSAIDKEGATWNGEPITVSRTSPLERAMVAFDFCSGEKRKQMMVDVLGKLGNVIGHPRIEGAVVMSVYRILEGTLDAYVQPCCRNWDCAAVDVIAREAGACVTTFSGAVLDLRERTTTVLVSCDKALHHGLSKIVIG